MLPHFLVAKEHGLQQVLPKTISLTRAFWLMVHSDMKDLARVRTVSNYIVSAVRDAHDLFLPNFTS